MLYTLVIVCYERNTILKSCSTKIQTYKEKDLLDFEEQPFYFVKI